MEIKRFECNPFGENTYIIWDSVNKEAAIIDPGMITPEEMNAVEKCMTVNNLVPKYILLTHGHIDHTFGVDGLKTRYDLPVLMHKADAPFAQNRQQQANMFHLHATLKPLEIDRFINSGSKLQLGEEQIEVIETPGHSLGGVCYYVPAGTFVLTGDTLFRGTVGRTDFIGGNHHQIVDSIKSKLLALPESTIVYPGHGPATTIGQEAISNPFF